MPAVERIPNFSCWLKFPSHHTIHKIHTNAKNTHSSIHAQANTNRIEISCFCLLKEKESWRCVVVILFVYVTERSTELKIKSTAELFFVFRVKRIAFRKKIYIYIVNSHRLVLCVETTTKNHFFSFNFFVVL